MKQDDFWALVAEMKQEATQPGRNKEVTERELQDIAKTIKATFGEKNATNFIRFCAHLCKGDTKDVIAALENLKDYDWRYEQAVKQETSSRAPSLRDRYDGFWGSTLKTSYNQTIYASDMPPQVRLFLKNNFELLSNPQKNKLPSLAP